MTAIADQSTMTIWPAWVWMLGVVVLALAALVLGLCRAAAKPAPEYEASPYGPMRRPTICDAHRPHDYRINANGDLFICVRCQHSVDREPADIDTIENYANGGAA